MKKADTLSNWGCVTRDQILFHFEEESAGNENLGCEIKLKSNTLKHFDTDNGYNLICEQIPIWTCVCPLLCPVQKCHSAGLKKKLSH